MCDNGAAKALRGIHNRPNPETTNTISRAVEESVVGGVAVFVEMCVNVWGTDSVLYLLWRVCVPGTHMAVCSAQPL